MRFDSAARPQRARWWRAAALLAIAAGLLVWWLVPAGDSADGRAAGELAPGPAPTPQAWDADVAKDPFGARNWSRGTSAGWVAPPVIAEAPPSASPFAAPAAPAAPVPREAMRAAPAGSRPATAAAPPAATPPTQATGDNAPGIGLEPAPPPIPE